MSGEIWLSPVLSCVTFPILLKVSWLICTSSCLIIAALFRSLHSIFIIHHSCTAIIYLSVVSFAIPKSTTNMNTYVYEHKPHASHAYTSIHHFVYRGSEEAFASSKNCLPFFMPEDWASWSSGPFAVLELLQKGRCRCKPGFVASTMQGFNFVLPCIIV